jgi:hypothetical protein
MQKIWRYLWARKYFITEVWGFFKISFLAEYLNLSGGMEQEVEKKLISLVEILNKYYYDDEIKGVKWEGHVVWIRGMRNENNTLEKNRRKETTWKM